jgi:CheY-like chemotaxis protein
MNSIETKMDFFEVGDKTSLICTDATIGEVVRATLRELGFKFHTAETSELAIERTRYNQYDIIVIQESFAGSTTLKSNAALNYLATLSMAQRRHSMIVLVGPNFKTLDALQALAQSVQLVVNTADLPNFTAILKKSWAEFQNLYKVYKDVFASLGEK